MNVQKVGKITKKTENLCKVSKTSIAWVPSTIRGRHQFNLAIQINHSDQDFF